MLNLKLRNEFLGSQMPGTAIALRRKDNTGAARYKKSNGPWEDRFMPPI